MSYDRYASGSALSWMKKFWTKIILRTHWGDLDLVKFLRGRGFLLIAIWLFIKDHSSLQFGYPFFLGVVIYSSQSISHTISTVSFSLTNDKLFQYCMADLPLAKWESSCYTSWILYYCLTGFSRLSWFLYIQVIELQTKINNSSPHDFHVYALLLS